MTNTSTLRKRPIIVEDVQQTARDPLVLIELLFFGYRDFVAEADRALAAYGFGRAHHRVLHFVRRHPGLSVAKLLNILGITKQSLSRVLRDLVDGGFVDQRPGTDDRRQRLLTLTDAGETLAAELVALQRHRVMGALQDLGDADIAAVERFLAGLIEPGFRPIIADMLSKKAAGGQ